MYLLFQSIDQETFQKKIIKRDGRKSHKNKTQLNKSHQEEEQKQQHMTYDVSVTKQQKAE